MWQKQLHDESENQSETANNESASTSTTGDMLQPKKPARINTETIEIGGGDTNKASNSNNNALVSSPTQVETIELEIEEDDEEEAQPKVEENTAAAASVDDENNKDSSDKDNNTSTSGGDSAVSPNNTSNNGGSSKKNKKKKKSKSRSRF